MIWNGISTIRYTVEAKNQPPINYLLDCAKANALAFLVWTALESPQLLKFDSFNFYVYFYSYIIIYVFFLSVSFMQMLTGDVSVTSGNALINNFSILTQLNDARKNLGGL